MKTFKTCKRCKTEYKTEQDFLDNTTFVGIQKLIPYNLFNLELRDCKCETTLARRLTENQPTLSPSFA